MSVVPPNNPRFTGIIPPMITPISARDRLDDTGLERLIEHILAGGVHGLFILGTTGEGPSLSYRLRRELIDRTCERVAGRVPVLVGVSDASLSESLELAGHAARRGADAVVLAPPFYFAAGQPELLEYLQQAADGMPLPVMLYNMPACTKIAIAPETLEQIIGHPNVVGLKDSSGEMAYFHRAQRIVGRHPDKSILVGPEELLAETALMGAHGGVSGGANLFPRLYVDLYEAAHRGRVGEAQRLHDQVLRVAELYRVGRHSSSTIKGIKCALRHLDVCSDTMAEPFRRFEEPERAVVRATIDELTSTIVKPPLEAAHG